MHYFQWYRARGVLSGCGTSCEWCSERKPPPCTKQSDETSGRKKKKKDERRGVLGRGGQGLEIAQSGVSLDKCGVLCLARLPGNK